VAPSRDDVPDSGPRRAEAWGVATFHYEDQVGRPFHCWWPYITSGCLSGVMRGLVWTGLT